MLLLAYTNSINLFPVTPALQHTTPPSRRTITCTELQWSYARRRSLSWPVWTAEIVTLTMLTSYTGVFTYGPLFNQYSLTVTCYTWICFSFSPPPTAHLFI